MDVPAPTVPPRGALILRLFGTLELTRADGTAIGSVLAQPKRLALLVYLALGSDGGFLRRDVLLDLFWPEFDQERARAALRKALYFLRHALGESVIVARGDEELGVGRDRLWCDALTFQSAVIGERYEEALELYRGDLLPGFYVTGQPDFEAWVDAERSRLRLLAARAAGELSDRAETGSSLERAVQHARQALELDPASDPSFRRLAGLLYRHGDRAGLAHAYEQWRTRLREAYGVEPAAETERMVSAALAARPPEAHPVGAEPAGARGNETIDSPAAQPVNDRSRIRRWLLPAAAVTGVAAVLSAVVLGRDASTLDRKRVFVSSLQNETGDPSLDPVGRIAADWIAHGLMEVGAVEVVSASSALLPDTGGQSIDVRALAHSYGAGTVVTGSYYLEGGRLRMQAQVLDLRRERLLHTISPIAVSFDSITSGADRLRERVAAAMAARFEWPAEWTELTLRAQPPTYPAYVEFVAGWESLSRVLLSGEQVTAEAADRFERAAALDTTFVLPRLYAALTYNRLNRPGQANSILRAVKQNAEVLSPYEKLLLEHIEAVQSPDPDRAVLTARRLNRLAPGSLLASYVEVAIGANRPREAVAAHVGFKRTGALLKNEDMYWRWLTVARHMLGDYRGELRDAQREHARQPNYRGPVFVEARALTGLGRIAEIESLMEETLRQPAQVFTPGAVMLHTAAELRAHGHHDAAKRVLERALAWHTAQPIDERPRLRETLARTLYEAGRYQEARALFEELLDEQPTSVMRLGFLGASAARLKDDAEVERISALLAQRRDRNPSQLLWRAQIAAVQDRPDEAIALLRRAFAEGLRYELWLHVNKDLDSLRGLAAFKELIAPKG